MSRQSRAYNGVDYSRCKSMTDVLAMMRCEIEKGDGMEYELLRQADTEPLDLKEWDKQSAKEDAR